MTRGVVPGAVRAFRRSPALLLIALVRAYQLLISPMLGPTCRYYPSCSAYAVQALRSHGALRGGWLTTRRLARCHPWSPGGVDHVPPPRQSSETLTPVPCDDSSTMSTPTA